MRVHLSAKSIAVKKDQDRTTFDSNKIILCDGIGEFPDSAAAAEITIDNLLYAEKRNEIIGSITKSAEHILCREIIGGTTLIMAVVDDSTNEILLKLAYIGNGSIFHLHGDFHELPPAHGEEGKTYRYSNLMIPHVDKEGVLLRHISHHSRQQELIPSTIELGLSGICGDIVLLFSDGISSLEDDVIIKDAQERLWRNQSENVALILDNLHKLLKKECKEFTQEKMNNFLERQLIGLKELRKLEDDASIGLIITDAVLTYYKESYVA